MKKNENYVITDGEKFIRKNIRGKFEQIGNIALADTYTSQTAKKVWNNSLNKSMKARFYVALVKDGELIKCDYSSTRLKLNGKKYNAANVELCPKVQAWVNKFVGLENVSKIAEMRIIELSSELSIVDQTISDLNHFIEWNKVNAAAGYKIESKLHELFVARRNIKDEIDIVDAICKYCPDKNNDIQNILKVIKGFQNRKYEPRVLKDLFETGQLA